MNLNGKILIIDDDYEDLEILREVFAEVLTENGYDNDIMTFNDTTHAYEYLRDTDDAPFLIISDINMPGQNGFELRRLTFQNEKIAVKAAPYIFLTTAGNDTELMRQAYKLSIQGYFAKPNDYTEYNQLITDIMRYWKVAKIPNRFD